MRSSNRSRKYSWEQDDSQPQLRPADLAALDLDEPASKTSAKGPPRRTPKAAARSGKKVKKKASRSMGPGMRIGFFLIVAGAVAFLLVQGGFFTDETGVSTERRAGETDQPSGPRMKAVSVQPDFPTTFGDTSILSKTDPGPEPGKDDAADGKPQTPDAPPEQTFDRIPPRVEEPSQVVNAPPFAASPTSKPVPSPPPPQSSEEVERLRARAEELISQGNIGQARLFLERAVRANDPQSTLLLAQTFDPVALSRWGIRNMSTNPARAQELYERARQLGVTIPPR